MAKLNSIALPIEEEATPEREQRFSADLAHELRTPLAASKTLAQLALTSSDLNLCHEYLKDILKAIDRASAIIENLSVLNSVDPDRVLQQRADIHLHALVASVIEELDIHTLKVDVQKSKMDIHNLVPPHMKLYANETCIRMVLRNIIDNAIRYAQTKPVVTVKAMQQGGNHYITVSDQGPGIEPALRARVLDRFYRIPGTGMSGSGLGLSIVSMICAAHAGDVALLDGEGGVGLTVRLRLPILQDCVSMR